MERSKELWLRRKNSVWCLKPYPQIEWEHLLRMPGGVKDNETKAGWSESDRIGLWRDVVLT